MKEGLSGSEQISSSVNVGYRPETDGLHRGLPTFKIFIIV